MAKAKSNKTLQDRLPEFVAPMLATLTEKPFDSADFIFEIKWDGYRTLAFIDDKNVNLYSRNNQSFNELFRPIQKALLFSGFSAILDGEIVVLNDQGVPDFNLIQNYGKSKTGTLVYYIFDILFFNGHSTQELPLINRKQILDAIPLPKIDELQVCKFVENNGIRLFEASKKMNLEGIIAKNKNSLYSSGRSNAWLKIKNTNDCEAVIIGYTVSPRKMYFASLLLAYFQEGEPIYVGHAGTGFTNAKEKELFSIFQKLITQVPTAKDVPGKYLKNVVWLQPLLVCRIQFAEITSEGKIRHGSFKSLIQKEAKEITAIC